jgi:hypothetical protein
MSISTLKIARPSVGNATFSQLLAPYQSMDYIPSNTDLLPILKTAYPSAEIFNSYSQSHMQVRVLVKDLIRAPIKNWPKNRPADITRCKDLAQYIYRSRKPVDSMIYLNLNHKKNIFEIFDGIHRYEAMIRVKDCIEHPDHMSSTDTYQEIAWLYNSYVILNLRISASEAEVTEAFLSLNKTIPVPDLYMRDVKEEKRICIEKVVDHMKTAYPCVFQGTSKPTRPHVNRDQLINMLDSVYDKMDLSKETDTRLQQAIDRLNQHISFHVPTKTGGNKITEGILQKCKATDCWLFLYPLHDLERMICSA